MDWPMLATEEISHPILFWTMNMGIKKLISPEGKCAFVIRDDDIGYFTTPSMLKKVYKTTWNKGFRVSFAVVPNHKAIDDLSVPPKERGKETYHPIYENAEIVNYLAGKIQEGREAVMLHGFSHEYFDGVAEFNINDETKLDEMTKKGLQILEETFHEDVRIFVPSFELISRAAIKVLERNNLTLLRRRTVLDTFLAMPLPSLLKSWIVDWGIERLSKGKDKKGFKPFYMKPAALVNPLGNGHRSNEIKQLQWSLLFRGYLKLDSPESIFKLAKELFLKVYRDRGCFILLHHSLAYFYDWEDGISLKDLHACYCSILDYVDGFPEINKTTLPEFLERADQVNKVQILQKSSEIKVHSPVPIQNLALKVESYDEVGLQGDAFLKEDQYAKILVIPSLEANKSFSFSVK